MKSFTEFSATMFSPITIAVLLYAFCSSSLLLINKIAIETVPAPSFILWLQLVASAIFVAVCSSSGSKTITLQKLNSQQALRFIPAAFGFLGVIYSNIKVLQYANVETFIVFRCSTPLFLSILDFACLGREMPIVRSWMSLLGILVGAVGYLLSQTSFQVTAFFWVLVWYAFFLFEMTYLKYICDTIDISNWSRVFYNNFIGLFPLTIAGIISGEYHTVSILQFNVWTCVVLFMSCIVGIGMSYLSFKVRSNVSATTFTVIGIMCKITTVALNYFYWDKHATDLGILCLLLCLLCGAFYKQAPMRVKIQPSKNDDIQIVEFLPRP